MKISVIIPVYNAERYIARCIDSVLAQTEQDFEIIAVNDCSKDLSLEILRSYADKDPRINIINHDKNLGPMVARMNGSKNAKGKYLTFIDGDDCLTRDALETLYETITVNNSDVVFGDFIYENIKGESQLGTTDINDKDTSYSVVNKILQKKLRSSVWGSLYKRELFADYNYLILDNFTNSEDLIMALQVYSHVSKIDHACKPVYIYKMNPYSSSQRKFTPQQIDNIAYGCRFAIDYASYDKNLKKQAERYCVMNFLALKLKGYSNKLLGSALSKYELQDIYSFSKISKLYRFPMALLIWCILNYISIRIINRN